MEGVKIESAVLPVGEILRPAKNPNKMTEFMFHSLVEGIKKDGFIYPVVLRKENKLIIDGDHRYLAAIECGMKEIPVIMLDVSEQDAVKIGIALNQKKGYFDYAELREVLLEVLPEADMATLSMDIGFTEIELQRLYEDSTFDSEKVLKQKLLEAGIPIDKVDAMAEVGKSGGFQDLPKMDIEGKQSNLRYPIVFFFDSEEDLNFVRDFFGVQGNREPSSAILIGLLKEKIANND